MRGHGYYFVKAIKQNGEEDTSFVGVCGTEHRCRVLVCGKYGYRHDHPDCDFILVNYKDEYVKTIAFAKRTRR